MTTYDRSYIVQYVEGDLPEEERKAFESELERNAALAAETSQYRELRAMLAERLRDDEAATALQATFQEMRDRYFGQAPVVARGKVRPMARAIAGMAAAVLLVFGGIWYFRGNGAALDRLGQTEMVTSTERGEQSDSVLQAASERFNAGQFDRALPLLDQAVVADSSSQLARFYRGVTLWRLGRQPEARVDLLRVYSEGSALQSEAAFYLALSYGKEKDTATALEWLRRIPDDAPASAKAKELNRLLQPAR